MIGALLALHRVACVVGLLHFELRITERDLQAGIIPDRHF